MTYIHYLNMILSDYNFLAIMKIYIVIIIYHIHTRAGIRTCINDKFEVFSLCVINYDYNFIIDKLKKFIFINNDYAI